VDPARAVCEFNLYSVAEENPKELQIDEVHVHAAVIHGQPHLFLAGFSAATFASSSSYHVAHKG
jgi:hypothetical protein